MENNTGTQPIENRPKEKSGKSRRGFASMDKERHKLVSSKGGQSPRSRTDLNSQRTPQGYSGF